MVDREKEAERLRRAADEAPQLVVLRGRRRVGKSYLINAALGDRNFIYFQADEGEEREHLDLLAGTVTAHTDMPVAFDDWEVALGYLGSLAERGPLVVALDEYQWMRAAQPLLDSKITRHFDRWVRDETPITLVLSGSALTLMEELLEGHKPMFGRASYRPLIEPFDYRYAAEFGPSNAGAEGYLRRYGVIGGTAQYQVWAGSFQLKKVLTERVLVKDGPFFEEPLQLIRGEEDIRDAGSYYSVLRAIAGGATQHNEIRQKSGTESSSLLSQRLRRLGELRYIERTAPVAGNGTSRWHLSDPFFAFWFRYIYPNRSRLQQERVAEVYADIVADLDNHMGPVFERVCRHWAGTYADIPEFAGATEIGAAWTRTHDLEVDLVARRGKKLLAVGSCKWSRSANARDLDSLIEARDRLPGASGAKLLVFARGFHNSLRTHPEIDQAALIGADRLF